MAITFGEWLSRNPGTLVGGVTFINSRGACDFRYIAETLGIRVENITLGTGGVVNRTPIPIDLAALCTSDKINMWSLRKPVRHSKREALTESEFKALNYGYNVTPCQFGSLATRLPAENYGWSYLKPTGGAMSQYRATDFAGYCHTAEPAWKIEAASDSPAMGENARFEIDFGNIPEWPMFRTGTWHLAVYVPNVGLWPVTNSSTGLQWVDILGNGRFSMPVTSGKFTAGTQYRVYPLLTTTSFTQTWLTPTSANSGLNFMAFPCFATITPRTRKTPLDNTSVALTGDCGHTFYHDPNNYGVPTIANIHGTVRITVAASPQDYQSTYVYIVSIVARAQNGAQSVDIEVGNGQLSFAMGQTSQSGSITFSYPGPIELGADPKDEDSLPLEVRYEVHQYTATGTLIGRGMQTVNMNAVT